MFLVELAVVVVVVVVVELAAEFVVGLVVPAADFDASFLAPSPLLLT
jgi:hypothetical protein